jgi:hypothetical protein
MATRQAASPAAATFVGADSVVVQGTATRPAGTVHVVDDGWRPLCGAPRVRFMFPAEDPATASCADCAAVADRRGKSGRRESVA